MMTHKNEEIMRINT